MSRAQECINKVVDLITTQGVDVAREFASKTHITIQKDGIDYPITILELMRTNAEKRIAGFPLV